MILYEINKLDLCDLTEEQIQILTTNILNTVNIKQLEERVHEVILKLSGVGEPTWNADLNIIALDNQKRLSLIYMLLNNMDLFKSDVKNLKLNKLECRDDFEKVYGFLLRTKDMIKSIIDYGEFSAKEIAEQQKYLADINNKYNLLENGDSNDK